MYEEEFSDKIIRTMYKLKKKDLKQFKIIQNKIDWILINPFHNYKYLRHDVKGFQRIYMGAFVLVFRINHEKKKIYFEDYDHHDKVYI